MLHVSNTAPNWMCNGGGGPQPCEFDLVRGEDRSLVSMDKLRTVSDQPAANSTMVMSSGHVHAGLECSSWL